jgi:homoserine dehydrogenase
VSVEVDRALLSTDVAIATSPKPLAKAGARVIRIGLLGYGRIGQAVAALVDRERARLQRAGVEIVCTSAFVRDLDKARSGPTLPLFADAAGITRAAVDVIVEVLGGTEPARTLVSAALRAGVPVVTANKTLVAEHGEELRAIAAARHTSFAYDAAVVAGVPFLGSLARRPLVAAARRLEGIVNGTSHFIVGGMERGVPFDAVLADAIARGYAEPDSAADTGGRDAAEKLTILLHLSGCHDVRARNLPRAGLEILEPSDFAAARRLGGVIKPVAIASLNREKPGAWIGPAFVPKTHPLAALGGVENALRVVGATGDVVTFSGPGAGPEATALTIVDDIIEAVSVGRAWRGPAACLECPVPADALNRPPDGVWFLGIGGDSADALPDINDLLGRAGATPPWIVQSGGWLGALTVETPWESIQPCLAGCRARGIRAIALPVISEVVGRTS